MPPISLSGIGDGTLRRRTNILEGHLQDLSRELSAHPLAPPPSVMAAAEMVALPQKFIET